MKKWIKLKRLALLVLCLPSTSYASSVFVGYDLGEMAFNDFKHFSGEVGYRFENDNAVRLSYFNIALSERHLSSNEAAAVDGDNVEGLWRGLDIYYDLPISNGFFFSPAIGYHDYRYSHVFLEESVRFKSAATSVAVSYLGDDFLGIDNIYWKFSIAFTYRFSPHERTILGDSVVNGGVFDYYPQLFIGYEFE